MVKKILTSKLLYRVLGIILGIVFIYAGAMKLPDPLTFASTIDGYGLVSWSLSKLLARVLPIVEIVTGLALIFNIRGALGMIVAQLLVFMAVLSYGIYMGLDADCGCFGPGESGNEYSGGLWPTLIRDAFMLGACLLMYWQRWAAGIVPHPLNPFKSNASE